MTIEEAVVESLKTLPPDKRQEVLDFAEFLRGRGSADPAGETARPRRSLEGLWTGLIEKPVTAEEIAEARREMWGNFPREDLL